MMNIIDIIVAPLEYTMYACWLIGSFFAFVATIDIIESHFQMWKDRRMVKA